MSNFSDTSGIQADMPQCALKPIERRLLNHWEKLADVFGMSRTSVAIISLLALREEPLSVTDMSRLLHVSRSTLSPCLREARRVSKMHIVHIPGSKKLYYELPFHEQYYGLEWMQWRTVRWMIMLIEPSIQVLEDAIRMHALSPPIERRMAEVVEGFQKQRVICHALTHLRGKPLTELLDKLVEDAQQFDAPKHHA